MKRLLTMLLSLVMSLTNNTSYSVVDNKEFPSAGIEANVPGDKDSEDEQDDGIDKTTGYYTIDVRDAPDYRDMMSENPSNLETNTCKTSTFTLHPKHVPSSSGFWVIDGKTPTIDNITVGTSTSLVKRQKDDKDDSTTEHYMIGGFTKGSGKHAEAVFSDSDNIVAPYDSTILTGGNLTLDTITLLCDKTAHGKDYYYKLVITGMRCWYCDYGRPNALDTSKPNALATHTFKKMQGHKIAAGCVVGRATKDTCITIYKCKKDGEPIDEAVSVVEFYTTK